MGYFVRRCRTQDDSLKGFSLIELLVVIAIVAILASVSYVGIQRAKSRALNEKMMDDLIMIANAIEDYRLDHDRKFPVPEPGKDQNVLCYYADATYAHECEEAIFRQGMIDNKLLSKRYLREAPTDPRTGSRYAYGVTNDGKYFQVAGIYEETSGKYTARTVENLAKGFELPSIIRAFNGPNFVTHKGTFLPYSDQANVLSAILENVNGLVFVNSASGVMSGYKLEMGDVIVTGEDGSADVYFSDGSISTIDPDSELVLEDLTVEQNDENGTITKILLKLNAGKIWSKVVRLADNSSFDVKTNSAIAGVRGTETGMGVDEGGNLDKLVVLAGRVDVDKEEEDEEEGFDRDDPTNEVVDTQEYDDQGEPLRDPETNRLIRRPRIARLLTTIREGGTPLVEVEENREMTTEEKTEYVEPYYEDIALTTSMEPFILKADGMGTQPKIEFRNLNLKVALQNQILGLNRKINATHITAYKVSDLMEHEDEWPLFESVTKQKSQIDVSQSMTEPHIITLPSEYFSTASELKEVIFRFENWETGLDGVSKLAGFSSFTRLPLILESGQELTKFDIYPEYFEQRPILNIMSFPNFVPVGDIITVEAELMNETFDANYVPDVSLTIADPNICSMSDFGITDYADGKAFKINLSAYSAGACDFTVKYITSSDEIIMSDLLHVEVVPATESLYLIHPPVDITLYDPMDTQFPFEWEAMNAPEGVKFEFVFVDAQNIEKEKGWDLSLDQNPPNEYMVDLSDITKYPAGEYRWSVEMYRMTDNNTRESLETKSASFIIERPAEGEAVDFSVTEQGRTQFIIAPGDYEGQYILDSATGPLYFDIAVNNADTESFTYEWIADMGNITALEGTAGAQVTWKIDRDVLTELPIEIPVTLTVVDNSTGVFVADIPKRVKFMEPAKVVSIAYTGTTPFEFDPEAHSSWDTVFADTTLKATLNDSQNTQIDITMDKCTYTPDYYTTAEDVYCDIPASIFVFDISGNEYQTYQAVRVFISVQAVTPGVCGDGLLETGEECDDGKTCEKDPYMGCYSDTECFRTINFGGTNVNVNLGSCVVQGGDGCSSTCNVETGWICEGQTGYPSCCRQCGDGRPRCGECDIANTSTFCAEDCYRCGDNYVNGSEECDDGGVCQNYQAIFCTSNDECYDEVGNYKGPCIAQDTETCNADCTSKVLTFPHLGIGAEAAEQEYFPNYTITGILIPLVFDGITDVSQIEIYPAETGSIVNFNVLQKSADFKAVRAGKYSLNIPGSQTAPLELYVCDHVGALDPSDANFGQECWVMGTAYDSCMGACQNPGGLTEVSNYLGADCDSYIWNDNTLCDICRILTGNVNAECIGSIEPYVPFFDGGEGICYFKKTSISDCFSYPVASGQRICKCLKPGAIMP